MRSGLTSGVRNRSNGLGWTWAEDRQRAASPIEYGEVCGELVWIMEVCHGADRIGFVVLRGFHYSQYDKEPEMLISSYTTAEVWE